MSQAPQPVAPEAGRVSDGGFSSVERSFFEAGEQIEAGAELDPEPLERAWLQRLPSLAAGGAALVALLVLGGFRSAARQPLPAAVVQAEVASLSRPTQPAAPLPAPAPPAARSVAAAAAPAEHPALASTAAPRARSHERGRHGRHKKR
jgi:hypothetical protein